MTEPITFLRDTFPQLFARGVELLESRAASGDERAARQLDDVKNVTGAAHLQVDDEAPVFLSTTQGKMTAGDAPTVEVKVAAAFPGKALRVLLGEATKAGALENDEVAIGAAQTASQRLETALADRPISCDVTVTGVPDLGDVTVRVGLNVGGIPDSPGFTAAVEFADIEAVQQGASTVQELFMGGKLRMEGDYSTALQVAMELMTNPL